MIGTYRELEDLQATFRQHNDRCVEAVVDFSKATFHADDVSMRLELRDASFADKDLHFRINPGNPSDPVASHAHKQFCKLVKVPYAFFAQNRPSMREQLVSSWLMGLAPGEASSRRLVKIRECHSMSMVRAILPESYASYPNHRVVSSLIRYGKDRGMSLAFLGGEGTDSTQVLVAVKFGEPLQWQGRSYRLGVEITFCDLSTDPLVAEALLVPEGGLDTYVLAFEYGPMLSVQYGSMPTSDMDKVISGLVPALDASRTLVSDLLLAAESMEFLGIEASVESVCSSVPSKALRSKVRREFLRPGAEELYYSAVTFSAGLSRMARSCSAKDGRQLERAAGQFLNFSLPAVDPAASHGGEEASQ